MYVLMGVGAGFLSLYYAKAFRGVDKRFHHWKGNPYAKALAGGLMLAGFYLVFAPLYGEGYEECQRLAAFFRDKFYAGGYGWSPERGYVLSADRDLPGRRDHERLWVDLSGQIFTHRREHNILLMMSLESLTERDHEVFDPADSLRDLVRHLAKVDKPIFAVVEGGTVFWESLR
ncbi:hypothetical protein ACQ86N_30245 [Puia sp. P3]|uniref:hypothetical protein n=1 Tax=Puia sp. P3 TaxID=3423952 RepID=UPI003D6755A3